MLTAAKGEQADICLINTCSVTEVADHKCRQAIHRMVRQHPGAFVVVTGCYAQLKPEQVSKIEGVDLVLGANEKANLIQFLSDAFVHRSATAAYLTEKTKDIRSFAPSCSRGNRTRYFLKVQDGCDYFCTYCTIPYARGFSRNPSIASLVAQAEQAAREGGKEIVLTGVNIGDFGKTTGEQFIDLVKALDQIEGIRRYRISSLEPDLLSDELIDFCAQSRAFMPHFHIPLQSGSDTVLRLMHRHCAGARRLSVSRRRLSFSVIWMLPSSMCSHIQSVLAHRRSRFPMWSAMPINVSAAIGCCSCLMPRHRPSISSILAARQRCSSRRRLAERQCMGSLRTTSEWNCLPPRPDRNTITNSCRCASLGLIMIRVP